MDPAGFVHVFQPGRGAGTRVLLLLHGTGGNERDLLPLGRMIDPNAALLGIRGQVLENGMPRYFRRISEGVFDEDDVKLRASQLAAYVRVAARDYGFAVEKITAVGFSNGANIALAIMWDAPELMGSAILFRPMLPYRTRKPAPLSRNRILLVAGRSDALVPVPEVELLEERLREAGADVTLNWQPAGHGLGQGDVEAARRWL